MSDDWRLLHTGPADGPTNMAIDQAIMEAVIRREVLPTLRFYGWQPPCLSLGRFQPVTVVNQEECRARGYDLVRRPTGGRAILHDEELTYALVVPQHDPRFRDYRDVLASYRAISTALVRGLERLGVTAQLTPAYEHPVHPATAACFDQPADYEITVGGRKLVGSAQARRGGVILQHGTVLLDVDLDALVAVLCPPVGITPGALRERLADRLTSLRQVVGRPVAFAEVAAALAEGFQQTFAVRLVSDELSVTERQRAERLRRAKYAAGDWTNRYPGTS